VRTFSDTVSVVFDVVREGFKPMLGVTLRICGPLIVITSVISAFVVDLFLRRFGWETRMGIVDDLNPTADANVFMNIFLMVVIVLGVVTLAAVASTLQALVVSVSIKHYESTGTFPNSTEIRPLLRKNFWRVILVSIVSTIMIQVASQFFYLPGIYLSVPLAMLATTVVVEDIDLGKGLSRVFALVNSRWFFSFGVVVTCSLAQFALLAAVAIPFIVVFAFGSALMPTQLSHAVVVAASGIAVLLYLVVVTFSNFIGYAASAVLYFQHSERVDGTDLARRVQSLAPLSGEIG
jgi:hypothetical protein